MSGDSNQKEMDKLMDLANELDSKRSKDGATKVEYKNDGVYLTVFPAQKWGIEVNEQNVLAEIEARMLKNVDFKRVRQAAQEMKGEPVYIAPPQLEASIDGRVIIEIAKNKMEAYLTIYQSRGGKVISRQDVDNALRDMNVVCGINEDVIEMALEMHGQEPLRIAQGSIPVDGENARIEFKVGPSSIAGKPTELVDGRVDFYNLNLIHNVEPGEVLAVKIPATVGVPGHTVTGEEMPAKPGKDMQLGVGKNVELTEENTKAVAVERGHVVITGNKLSVSTVYEIKGDVDFNTGNIEFNGSVIVKGSINEGFKVTASGDVEVLGTICDGVVECTGSVKVKNGVVGRNKSRIKAGGSIFTRFVENSTLESGGDVVIGEAIMHSKVSAKKSVVVGGKGVIVGGLIRAGEEINCKIVGSPMATLTELETGVIPELRRRYVFLVKEQQAKELDYDKADKAVKLLKNMQATQGSLSPDKQAILIRVTRAQSQLAQELDEMKELLEELEPQISLSERGKILVQGVIHPGVKVTIGSASMHIQDEYPFVSLTKVNEEIKINPYK